MIKGVDADRMSPRPPRNFVEWPEWPPDAWLSAAGAMQELLETVDAGQIEATPSERLAMHVFVSTVRGILKP